MNIIVDLMGSDKGLNVLLEGVMHARSEYNFDMILVGNKEEILTCLEKNKYDQTGVEIVGTSEVISNQDNPVASIRRKKDSSMVVAAKLLKEGRGDGLISTGNTGALLASGLFIVGRIDGIERAAISAPYPTKKGISLLLDAGANADSRPEHLLQFARMGSIYYEAMFGRQNPKLGLINVGSEEGKGNKLTKETFTLLDGSGLNFYGNIEARDMTDGNVDVFVCDGFTGNILLKATEGTAIFLVSQLKDIFLKSVRTKVAAGLISKELSGLKELMDYREYGGAPLLGIKSPVVKAHGSSDSLAFKNAIKQLIDFIEKDIIKSIEESIK